MFCLGQIYFIKVQICEAKGLVLLVVEDGQIQRNGIGRLPSIWRGKSYIFSNTTGRGIVTWLLFTLYDWEIQLIALQGLVPYLTALSMSFAGNRTSMFYFSGPKVTIVEAKPENERVCSANGATTSCRTQERKDRSCIDQWANHIFPFCWRWGDYYTRRHIISIWPTNRWQSDDGRALFGRLEPNSRKQFWKCLESR